ncbi:MAG: polysaccharide pyruvyl transferase family protein [bacterium]
MNDVELLSGLAQRVRDEVQRATPAGPVALLDFPNYGNPGDSAIWLGALSCLSSLGFAPPVYTSESRTFDERMLRRALPAGTILLTGGGNLGDLWPEAQLFRERVLRAFPDHAIVQLPQTIHFSDPTMLARARSAFRAHPNFTVLVRDARSLRTATDYLECRAALSPDLAFALAPGTEPALAPERTGTRADTLHLLRKDHESRGLEALDARGSVDWTTDDPRPITLFARRLGDYLIAARSAREPSLGERAAQQTLAACYTSLARHRLRRGCRLLRSSRVIVTDRLHGHVISLLLGIPHIVLGDRHGKLHGFVDRWTAAGSLVRWANAPSEVPGLTRELLGLDQARGG